MPLNPLGLYHITLVGEMHGQITQNGFYFQTRSYSTGSSYQSEATDLLQEFNAYILPKFVMFCSDDWHARSAICVTLIPNHTVLLEQRITLATGAQPDDSLPSFCSALLSTRTGVGGRSAHGRIYVPAPSEDHVASSRIQGSSLTQLQDIGTALLARFGNGGSFTKCRYGVFSRKLGTTRNAGPPATLTYNHAGFFPVTEVIARAEIASMRKRQLFRGE